MPPPERGTKLVIHSRDLDSLFDALHKRGYTVIGPTRRDQAIVCDVIEVSADLPAGWTDEQDAGTYRLNRRADGAWFGYNVGPTSWKRWLFPPELRLWRARRAGASFEVSTDGAPTPRFAFLGVRACELAAIAVQDRVFGTAPYADPVYVARRSEAMLIAVECGQAGATCFCDSMQTGPHVRSGFDIALTEVVDSGRHVFIATAGSDRGAEVLEHVPHAPASDPDLATARRVPDAAVAGMKRRMHTDGLPALLAKQPEHPRWAQVAERCLSCGNCTMACPTCFCHTVEDVTDLTGTEAERVRRWDSCFSSDFSYIHGGSVRPSTRSRYRQWLTHKLSNWHAQFGMSGCVGCGRCITWCPARIDITEEVLAIQGGSHPKEVHNADA